MWQSRLDKSEWIGKCGSLVWVNLSGLESGTVTFELIGVGWTEKCVGST